MCCVVIYLQSYAGKYSGRIKKVYILICSSACICILLARTLTALCRSSSKSKGFRSIASSGASRLCNALSDISRAAGVSPATRASDRLFALQTQARLCVDTCVQIQAVCLPRRCRVCFEPSSQRPIQVQVISPPFLTTRKLQPTATVAGLEMEC